MATIRESLRVHPHLCPICRKPFNCAGIKCAQFTGVAHLTCAPKNKASKWTREVSARG
jgi:hypothetical protein